MGTLDGKVALITGAARGQGRSHAVAMAREGAGIIAVDICANIGLVPYDMATREELDETVGLVREVGRHAVAAVADVRDLTAVQAAADRGVDELGRLDIVVANAGIVIQEVGVPGWEMSQERWRALIDTNLTGVWHTLRATIPAIIRGGRGGSIVITSSTAGLKGWANICDYASAKHGLVGLMRTLAQELAPYSIRINTIHPNGVATPMVQNEMMEAAAAAATRGPAADTSNMLPVELMEPSDISDAVLWLVSDAARFVTAVALPVDAGFTQK
jgi:SDR family mycofactocin-dependent oxidoreductase